MVHKQACARVCPASQHMFGVEVVVYVVVVVVVVVVYVVVVYVVVVVVVVVVYVVVYVAAAAAAAVVVEYAMQKRATGKVNVKSSHKTNSQNKKT